MNHGRLETGSVFFVDFTVGDNYNQVPLFTQDLPRHDVLLVADVANDFARYIAFNTWEARPVAGSEGLMPANARLLPSSQPSSSYRPTYSTSSPWTAGGHDGNSPPPLRAPDRIFSPESLTDMPKDIQKGP